MIDLEGVFCVADVARVQARLRGDAPAQIFEGRTSTFGEVDAMASRIARALIASATEMQGRVAYLSKNTDHFLPWLIGACKARMALTPINFRLAAPEIARIVDDCGARILVVGPDAIELAEKAVASLASKPRLIALGFDRQGYQRREAWAEGAGSSDPRLAADPDDDVVQLYTSGTTGLPKGVRLTNRNYLATFRLAAESRGLDYDVGDTVLGAMPFFHVAGVNVALIAMASGARSAIVRDVAADPILDLIGKERVNHAFLAPAIIMMLMHAPKMACADLSSMKALSYGASPISEDLLAKARARFRCQFIQFYGMTETTGVGTFLPDDAHDPAKGKLRSCGVAWPGVEVKIVAADGSEAPRGAVGEVLIRSPVVMKGYWGKPEETAASVRDGWMRTGDRSHGRGRLCLHLRSPEGHDRDRRRERLSGRGGKFALRPSGDCRRRGDRRARRDMGRDGEGDRRRQARRAAGSRRHHRLRARAHRALQGAEIGRFRRRHPAQYHRQDPPARIAQALLGGA
jgi:acyl-CoA synthetase (AMP-forming)/AMP-acid ligase II